MAAGALLNVTGALFIEAGATFAPLIDRHPGAAATITFVVAIFQTRSGSFVPRSAIATFAGADCFQFGPPTQARLR